MVATASSFFLFNCRTESFTFAGACVLLRNQFVAGGSQTPRLPCSTCSPQVVTLSGRRCTEFGVYTKPAGFLTKQTTRNGTFTRYRQASTQGPNTSKHTMQRCRAADSQTASAHNRTIQWSTITIYPIRRHSNLTHYTTLALN